MKQYKLVRIAHIPDGTFGVLFDGDIPFCLTLEREWKDNKRGESCIPTGFYYCDKYYSEKFGWTFKVREVINRSGILFHKGNIEDDSHGCIIVGEEYGRYKNKIAVLSSGKAFQEFRNKLVEETSFRLEITNGD